MLILIYFRKQTKRNSDYEYTYCKPSFVDGKYTKVNLAKYFHRKEQTQETFPCVHLLDVTAYVTQ